MELNNTAKYGLMAASILAVAFAIHAYTHTEEPEQQLEEEEKEE
jgi:hypothetical protein